MDIKIFVNENDEFGTLHRIIFDERREISSTARLNMAKELRLDEIVFINDLRAGDMSIFSQTREVPFAGSAALAAVYALQDFTGELPRKLTCQGKTIKTMATQTCSGSRQKSARFRRGISNKWNQ